ncbi:tRNA A-37 threonylcarbamoyl transferase component Bud32 [Catenulispora sp. EB89]|uniref:serine/threonine-protein kinase n=1 Tax=Catenulispora sp. EB89 TaxID=3156257 RepID=UPI003516DE42
MDVGRRYVLGPLIGEGATACVYEAEDTVLRREVAVKVFRYTDIGDTRSERVDEETRILASLAHPHLLPVYDSGLGADRHRFIVMPLVRGTTLARLAARGPVEPREVKRIGAALADALSHIHAGGIVHRDVKPGNVLLADDGTAYLADFGYAHAADSPALTSTDCVVGTAGYLAPEQAQGLSVTSATDVYALGLVLLEALSGERAYQGTPMERATANALRPPRIPARLGPGWMRVLRTLTARDPAVRPAAGEVGGLLAVAEDELPAVRAGDHTMELPVVDAWGSGVGSGDPGPVASGPGPVVSEPVASEPVVGSAASTRRPLAAVVAAASTRRRLAGIGVAACAAVAVVGLGADWLTPGASADTQIPAPMTPGAGAAGSSPGPTSSPGTAAVPSGSVSARPSTAAVVARTSASVSSSASASKNCQADQGDQGDHGQNGKGHHKDGCHH